LSTCFGHPCAHHQEKIAVSMRHWYLSLCMGGVRSAGLIFNPGFDPRTVQPVASRSTDYVTRPTLKLLANTKWQYSNGQLILKGNV